MSPHSNIPCPNKCEETLRNYPEELHIENVVLKEKIVDLSAHETKLKIKWEEENIVEQVAHQREQFNRFIPQK